AWPRGAAAAARRGARPAGLAPARYPLFSRRYRVLLPSMPLQQPEAVGQQRQAGAVVEASPGPPLEVVQAQRLLQLLVALLHRPAALPQADRLLATRPRRQVGEGELQLAVGLLLDQQPDRPRPGAGAVLPALARPDAQPGEARRQLALGALTPGHLAQPHPPGQLAHA